MTYTAIIKNDGKQWLGWIEELPSVNCQEYSYEDLLETLRITLIEALDLAGVGYKEQVITV
jgi:predicted RNase H-like HicB family nuclease